MFDKSIAGGTLWVLNGARNRAHQVTVKIVDETIVVSNDDKDGELLEFNFDGTPYVPDDHVWKHEPPLLVPYNDPTATELERVRLNKEYGERVKDAVDEYKRSEDADHWMALADLVAEWGANNGHR